MVYGLCFEVYGVGFIVCEKSSGVVLSEHVRNGHNIDSQRASSSPRGVISFIIYYRMFLSHNAAFMISFQI